MASKRVQLLKTPKGTVDYSPEQTNTISKVTREIEGIYRAHGGEAITTPMFELRDILMNKYGEDTKLIYDLDDQGGDMCSLRYDLTVPFSRYLSMNRISKMRRYQIGTVYRRDNPSFKTGRLREFMQADFDICGENIRMVNDAEILKMVNDILGLYTDQYVIRVNDRRILCRIFDECSIPRDKHAAVSSAIDKSDKLAQEEIRKELAEKGISGDSIARLYAFLSFQGTNEEKMEYLRASIKDVAGDKDVKNANAAGDKNSVSGVDVKELLDELSELFGYLKTFQVKNVVLDFSLARGLDYYTGLILEASLLNSEVGSVIGGGRYDNLCESISTHKVPCVGFSVGITRLCLNMGPTKTVKGVFVGSSYGAVLHERLSILNELWDAGIPAETFSGRNSNFNKQMEFVRKNNFKFFILTGMSESERNAVVSVDLANGEKTEISRDKLLDFVKGGAL